MMTFNYCHDDFKQMIVDHDDDDRMIYDYDQQISQSVNLYRVFDSLITGTRWFTQWLGDSVEIYDRLTD